MGVKTYLSLLAYAVVEVAARGKLHDEKNVRMCVDDLVETHDMRVLQLFHDLHLEFDLLLEAKLSDFVLVENLEGHCLVDRFIVSHCARWARGQIRVENNLHLTLPYAPYPKVRPTL